MLLRSLLLACVLVGSVPALPSRRARGTLHHERDESNASPILAFAVEGSTGKWSLEVDGKLWFNGNVVSVTHSNRTFSNEADAANKLTVADTEAFEGTDSLGDFKATETTWDADGVSFVTAWRAYRDAVVFEQRFPDGLSDTGPGRQNKNGIITAFPTFDIDDHGAAKGFVQYGGSMAGNQGARMGKYQKDAISVPSALANTGPLLVFDAAATCLVWSPASSFMSVNQNANDNVFSYGLLGSITSVPAGHSMSVIVSVGSGINQGTFDWGAKLLAMYGKDRRFTDSDFGLNHLGYSTDNGAYYYYFTEQGKNYEDTLIDLKAHVDEIGLPIRHILLDSWWYFKGPNNGVTKWEPMPDIFPHGLEFLYNATQWPVVAHNRFWSSETPYAKQNGGEWEFIVEHENNMSIPVDQGFWDYLMQSNKQWGLLTYEQDWLHNEFETLNATLTSATLGREWLMQMGSAAERNGLTVQYCMSYCRHMLQSVEIPAVTQARGTGDYHPGGTQWNLGLTSMFLHAIAVRPSKDNWWSTRNETWMDEGNDRETQNRLQSAIAILSTGPYTPADMIGGFDVALIMRGAMQDGTLLQPDRPLTHLDANLMHLANSDWKGPSGYVYHTTSGVSGLTYHYVLAVDNGAYALQPHELGVRDGMYVAFETNSTDSVQPFSASSPVNLPAVPSDARWDFNLWTFVPLLANGWAVVGETGKWVAAASARFVSITATSRPSSHALVRVLVRGYPGESVTLGFVAPKDTAVQRLTCVVSEQGSAAFVMPARECTSA